MPRIRQFDTHKIVFLQQGDSQRAISWKLGTSWHDVKCVLEIIEETGQVEDTRSGTPQNLQLMNCISKSHL